MLHNKANELMEPLELLAGGLAMANRRIDNLGTAYSGSASFNNADGSMTVIGPMAGDFSFATHVGDTTPPPPPAGIECSSVDGTVLVTWDGTLMDEMPPDFYCVNISINGVLFAQLTEAGSANSPKLESGVMATISVTSEDDACLWDGTPAHNVSEPITVEIEVRDVVGEAKAEAKEAIDTAKESAEKVVGIEKTTDELSSTVSIAQETAENAVTAASKAQQDIDGFKTTVEETYLSKGDAETTYTAKSEFEQTTEGLSATVTEAASKADTAITKATQAELTAEGFSVAITEAQQSADDAKKVATNYLSYTATDGLVVADQTEDRLGDNVQIKPGAVNIRSGETTNASFTSNKIALGINSENSIIDLNDGKATIAYNQTQDPQAGIYQGTQINGTLGTSITHRGMPGQSSAFQVTNDGALIRSSTELAVQAPHVSFTVGGSTYLGQSSGFKLGSNGTGNHVAVLIGDGELAGAWRDRDAQWMGTMDRLGNLLNSWETANRAPSDNLNDIKRSGIFLWQPSTIGIPQANTWGVGLSLSNALTASSNTWCMQLGMCTNDDGKIWVRQSINNGAWTAWKQVGDNVAYTAPENSLKALGVYVGNVATGPGSSSGWRTIWNLSQFTSKFGGWDPTDATIYCMDQYGGNSSIVYDTMVDINRTVWLRARTDEGVYTGAVNCRYVVIVGSNA